MISEGVAMDLLAAPDRLLSDRPFDLTDPFTPAMAARVGLGRASLERQVRDGHVVRLVRGVYIDAAAPLTPVVRARSLSLVVSSRHLIVDRTAAWVYGGPGLRTSPGGPIALDVAGKRRYPGDPVQVRPEEITVLGGVRCTSPLRTALDVARHLAPERALPLLDGLIRCGALTHRALMEGAAAMGDLPGITQARELAAIADGRAAGTSESLLRMHWLAAQLPTPVPGWKVAEVRLSLALPVHRFGVVLSSQRGGADRARARQAGWTVLVLDELRVCRSDAASVGGHLEREFHRHLLGQMGQR